MRGFFPGSFVRQRTRLLLSTALVSVLAAGSAAASPLEVAALSEKETAWPAAAATQAAPAAAPTAAPATAPAAIAPAILPDAAQLLPPHAAQALELAYLHNAQQPLWTRNSADALRHALTDRFGYAVRFDTPAARAFDAVIERRFGASDEASAAADIALSAAFLTVADTLAATESGTGGEATLSPRTAGLATALLAAARGAAEGDTVESALSGLEPQHPQYLGLKRVWQTYDAHAKAGGWQALDDGPLVRPGDADPRLPALRTRLRAEGFDVPAPAADSAATLDPALEAALRAFQRRHGLDDDGVLGPNTLAALNETAAAKRDRIAGTLQRWRATPLPEGRHVFVNIPSYTAAGWNGDRPEISMRAIVGQRSRQTPELVDTIEYVVTDPTWNVPISILKRDKLPKLREDPGWAPRAGFHIYDRTTGAEVAASDIDWTAPGVARRYNLIQSPGPNNALGQLKIMFPNEHAVYLHGTPDTHLFARTNRAFSSGCVRLEAPEAMAAWIAGPQDERLRETLAARRAEAAAGDGGGDGKDNRWYRLAETLPVRIAYFTVTAEDDGGVTFWRDIYERDEPAQPAAVASALHLGAPAHLAAQR